MEQTIVIVGQGPAGISAALYAVRGGASTIVLGKDGGALQKASEIENYFGFPQVISGTQLLENGYAQAKRLGVQLYNEEVVNIGFGEKLQVKTTERELEADAVVIATGAARKAPGIEGLNDFEGKGVSYCAVCDAFFYKNKAVAVLGSGDYALHEAETLLPVAASVTLLTNGEAMPDDLPKSIAVNTKKLAAFCGGDVLDTVTFEDGSILEVAGVFVAVGVAGSTDLARKIGAITEGARIVVDENMATNVPGLYAAGDCTGGLLQVAKAVHEGAVAGISAVQHLKQSAKK